MDRVAGSRLTRTMLAGGVAAALAAAPAAAQVVDTRSHPVTTTSRGLLFGLGGPVVIGQTFTAPSVAPGNVLLLQDFTFYFFRSFTRPGRELTEAPATFHVALQAIEGTSVVGDVLFASALQTGPAERSVPFAIPYVFDVGGLRLTPGAQYFAYLHDDGLPGTSHTVISASPLTDYAGGMLLVGPSLAELGPIRIAPPPPIPAITDLPFVATFSTQTVTPEPATLALVGGGLLALGGVGARRRRGATAR